MVGLQTVIPLLIRDATVKTVEATPQRLKVCSSDGYGASVFDDVVPNHTIVVLYPSLQAVGGFAHDMCACIVRQDYTGAHSHALG